MPKIDLHGIFPPITTPFVAGNVAYDELASNIEKWSKTGLKGLVVMGSNGEYVYLSADEKRKLVAKAVELTPKHMSVIAGTGCESTKETIELTRDCAELGAHAALVVTPHYYGGRMNETALLDYTIARAEEFTGLRRIGTASRVAGVFSFILDGAHAADVGMLLDQQGIAVRTGHHCAQPIMDQYNIQGTVRASFALYNTHEEVDRLFDALAKVQDMLL